MTVNSDSMHTHNSQCRPTKAGNSQRRPTKANAGQRRPTAANQGQCRPTKMKKGPNDVVWAIDSDRYVFFLIYILFFIFLLLVGLH